MRSESYCISWFLLCGLAGTAAACLFTHLDRVNVIQRWLLCDPLSIALVGLGAGLVVGFFLDYALHNIESRRLRVTLFWSLLFICIIVALRVPVEPLPIRR